MSLITSVSLARPQLDKYPPAANFSWCGGASPTAARAARTTHTLYALAPLHRQPRGVGRQGRAAQLPLLGCEASSCNAVARLAVPSLCRFTNIPALASVMAFELHNTAPLGQDPLLFVRLVVQVGRGGPWGGWQHPHPPRKQGARRRSFRGGSHVCSSRPRAPLQRNHHGCSPGPFPLLETAMNPHFLPSLSLETCRTALRRRTRPCRCRAPRTPRALRSARAPAAWRTS